MAKTIKYGKRGRGGPHKGRRKHRGGGVFDSITNGWTSLTQKTKSWWQGAKSAVSTPSIATPAPPVPAPAAAPAPQKMPEMANAPATQPMPRMDQMQPPPQIRGDPQQMDEAMMRDREIRMDMRDDMGMRPPQGAMGGRRRRHKKSSKRGGGTAVQGIAERGSIAANTKEYSGVETAQPQAWVGGKRRRRRRGRRGGKTMRKQRGCAK